MPVQSTKTRHRHVHTAFFQVQVLAAIAFILGALQPL